jgi:hypothetical protein
MNGKTGAAGVLTDPGCLDRPPGVNNLLLHEAIFMGIEFPAYQTGHGCVGAQIISEDVRLMAVNQ